jgi:hypothetical protein
MLKKGMIPVAPAKNIVPFAMWRRFNSLVVAPKGFVELP